jgi:recombinational DNA repair protein (RecF pathway)
MYMIEINVGSHPMEGELHIHSCTNCPADYLSKYVKPPKDGGLCRRCIEVVYNDARRQLSLREKALKEFREEDEQKRKEDQLRRNARERQRKP